MDLPIYNQSSPFNHRFVLPFKSEKGYHDTAIFTILYTKTDEVHVVLSVHKLKKNHESGKPIFEFGTYSDNGVIKHYNKQGIDYNTLVDPVDEFARIVSNQFDFRLFLRLIDIAVRLRQSVDLIINHIKNRARRNLDITFNENELVWHERMSAEHDEIRTLLINTYVENIMKPYKYISSLLDEHKNTSHRDCFFDKSNYDCFRTGKIVDDKSNIIGQCIRLDTYIEGKGSLDHRLCSVIFNKKGEDIYLPFCHSNIHLGTIFETIDKTFNFMIHNQIIPDIFVAYMKLIKPEIKAVMDDLKRNGVFHINEFPHDLITDMVFSRIVKNAVVKYGKE